MAMETVTNYTCDRCGRSEIKDGVKILTLTIRERTQGVSGQGKSLVSAHVCANNCLKMIKAAMAPVGQSGRYDRKAAAERRAATNGATKSDAVPTTAHAKSSTKGGTKKPRTATTSKIKGTGTRSHTDTAFNALPAHVRAVRAQTRTPSGGWAKGHNFRTERRMIAEAEAALKIKSKGK